MNRREFLKTTSAAALLAGVLRSTDGRSNGERAVKNRGMTLRDQAHKGWTGVNKIEQLS